GTWDRILNPVMREGGIGILPHGGARHRKNRMATLEALPPPITPAAAPTAKAAAAPAATPRQREWSPHMWVGMDFFAWLRLPVPNLFAVQGGLVYVAGAITLISMSHPLARVLQKAIWGRRISKTAIREPPIFVLGHWRTGTTHLHDLLALDERFTAP